MTTDPRPDPRTPKPPTAGDPSAYYTRLSGDLREEWRLVRRLEGALDTAACLASDHAEALRQSAVYDRALRDILDHVRVTCVWVTVRAGASVDQEAVRLVREVTAGLKQSTDAGLRYRLALEGIAEAVTEACPGIDPAEKDATELVMAVLARLADAERQLAELRQAPTPTPGAKIEQARREAYDIAASAAAEARVRQLDADAAMGLMLDRLHQLAWPLSYRPADPLPPADPA